MMGEERSEKIEIFERAAAMDPEERGPFLERACAGDTQLRETIERLLEAHDVSGILDGQDGKSAVPPLQNAVVEGIAEKPGDRLGPYRLVRLLGEGGFGAVFLAEQDAPLSRKVALKILKPGMDSRHIIARFQAERQALARMDHPCIARVFDAGATEMGRPYFAMEYVEGTSLTRYCDEREMSVRERLQLFLSVAQAVHHAHQKGVIHRDLKPSNLMVTEVEGKPLPKVIDFGIAKALREPLTDATMLTQWGQVVGTPEYMSPEQAESSGRALDIRCDVYSLGVVLYELLVGVRPFQVERNTPSGYREWMQRVRNEDPTRPSLRFKGMADPSRRREVADKRRTDPSGLERLLRRELDWIVLKAIDRDRDRRYASVAALADDLHRHLRHETVQATPPSASYRLGQFARRHKGFLSAAAAVLLALLGGLGFATYAFFQASHERDSARLARDESEAVVSFLSEMLASADPADKGRDVTVVDLLEASASDLSSSFKDQPLVEARLHDTVGKTYLSLGREEEAGNHLRAAAAIREKELGPQDELTLMSMASLGSVYYAQGYFDKAEEHYRQALQGLGRIKDEDEQIILGLMNNLAQIHAQRGELEEAEALQIKVLQGQSQSLGPKHANTLGSRVNLAQLKAAMGRAEESHRMLEEVVVDWVENFGDHHPGTLLAINNLAISHMRLNRWTEAEILTRQVWEARKKFLGEHHFDTWGAQFNLATVLATMGRDQEAYGLLEDMLMAPPGKSLHPVRVDLLMQSLGLYESKGWPAEVQPILPRLAELLHRVVDYPQATANQLNSAAWFLLNLPGPKLSSPETALRAAARACQIERSGKGRDLWLFLDTLALAQHSTGDSLGAVRTQQEAIELIPDHSRNLLPQLEEHLRMFQAAAAKVEPSL
ncbi:MAG TPA: tetratricopeptide repeat protein [Acidobacteriota bacterium]|nr:tetratricopeptide repeat protein [Acidobacteriota bacterium]